MYRGGSSESSDDELDYNELSDDEPSTNKRRAMPMLTGTKKNDVWGAAGASQDLADQVSGVLNRSEASTVERQSESYDRSLGKLAREREEAAKREAVKMEVGERTRLHVPMPLGREIVSYDDALGGEFDNEFGGGGQRKQPESNYRKRRRFDEPLRARGRGRGRGSFRGGNSRQSSSGRDSRNSASSNGSQPQQRRPVHDRLGQRRGTPGQPQIMPVELDGSETIESVSLKIARSLHEPKAELTRTIGVAVGVPKMIELYKRTLEVEQNGGMLVLDGVRRKTPGGVFIQLFKDDESVSREMINSIFEKDRQQWRTSVKSRRRLAQQKAPEPVSMARVVAMLDTGENGELMEEEPVAGKRVCANILRTPVDDDESTKSSFGELPDDARSDADDDARADEPPVDEEGRPQRKSSKATIPPLTEPNTPTNSRASSSNPEIDEELVVEFPKDETF